MYKERKRNKIIIISLLVIVFIMAGAYSAFSSQLSIKSSSKVTSNWDIEITNVTDGVASGSAENASSPTWDALKASMEANLYSSGDSMEYDVTISNKGTLDAKLDDITTNLNNSNSDAVIITFSGYTKGEKLLVGESKVVHVKIAYNPSYTGDETSSEVEINFDYVQNNNETEPSSNTYLLTYDCETNGGNSCSNNNEYLVSDKLVDLTKVGTKDKYVFVGWNTDKNATSGLESYSMPNSDSTLYAIYSKTLNVSYVKGSNVSAIGKEKDSCTLYNNDSSCNVTLPSITVNTGYSVSGWYDGDTKAGNVNDKYKVTKSISLTGKAKANTYTVTYDYSTNGGTSSTKTSATVSYGSSIDLTPTATKSGYTFVGWNTNKDATSKLSSLTMGTSNVTLYAIYRKEAKTITITFNKNGASTQTNSSGTAVSDTTVTRSCTIAAVYNNVAQATSCNITSPTIVAASGFGVVGYNTSSSATSSSWSHNTAKAVSSNATYYAITKSSSAYTATFNANGSTISSTSVSCSRYNGASSCNITSPTITRSGFTITGWGTSASATSASYKSGASIPLSGNVTYYAVTSKAVTVTFSKGSNVSAIGSTSGTCTIQN